MEPVIEHIEGPHWHVISVYHMPQEENQGRHHVYVNVLDENGFRAKDERLRIAQTWEGRKPEEAAPSALLDKPPGEAMGNIPIFPNQILTIWIEGDDLPSDKVKNLRTDHAENWGLHSFKIIFQRQEYDLATRLSKQHSVPVETVLAIMREVG